MAGVGSSAPDLAGSEGMIVIDAVWHDANQRCIRAYYDGDLAGGLVACETVLAAPDLPAAVRDQTLRNEVFYAPALRDLVAIFDHRPIELPLPAGWFPLNPSIARDDDGFLMVVRAVDYELTGPGEWLLHDPAGVSSSENHLLRLDDALAVRSAQRIVDDTLAGPRCPCAYAGLEDCRLFRWGGGWRVACGVVDRHPSCVGHIAVATLELESEGPRFRDLRIVSEIGSLRWEKNWMPFRDGDDLRFVYSCGPTEVLRFDPARGSVSPTARHPAPPIAGVLRGGSQGVRVDGGWLFAVHQSADFDEGNRCYLHRWLKLDDGYRLTHLSPPFTLLGEEVEFCAGLARDGDRLVASFGVGDREAHLLDLSLPEVLALLRPLPGSVESGDAGGGREPAGATDTAGGAASTASERAGDPITSAAAMIGGLVTPNRAHLARRWADDDLPDPDWVLAPDTDVGPIWTRSDDREIGRWLRDRGTWGEGESLLFRRLVKWGMHIVDVGANVGFFTLLFASLVGPRGRVLAIEAEPINARLLAANVAMHRLANVDILPVAVDRARGEIRLALCEAGNLGGYSGARGGGPTAAPAWPLDDLVNPNVPVHLVKIDIEGMDHRAVAGMRGIVQRWAPTVVAEFHPALIAEGGDRPEEVLAGYAEMGFEVSVLGWDIDRLAHEGGMDLRSLVRRNGHVMGDEAAIVAAARALGTINLVLRPLPGRFLPPS
jgi:FkbM family methyltransferase